MLHRCTIGIDGWVYVSLPPEVQHDLLSLLGVEQVAVITPYSQEVHLLPIGRYICA